MKPAGHSEDEGEADPEESVEGAVADGDDGQLADRIDRQDCEQRNVPALYAL
jgi:hypothetical protein